MKILKKTNQMKFVFFLLRIDVGRVFFFHTNGCFVNQCRRTFKTLIVDAVLTMIKSLGFCSREFDDKVLLLVVDICAVIVGFPKEFPMNRFVFFLDED